MEMGNLKSENGKLKCGPREEQIPLFARDDNVLFFVAGDRTLHSRGGSFLEGGFVRARDCIFVATEAFDVAGKLRPLGALEREEQVVNNAEAVLAAVERSF